ncbi:MAG: transporter substrate-binding domain-containing protein, partial [Alphaproteobacteria bacterium]|nr:transporter substrate-binding domain-containing protein [Alphaproteobacteria bacterium]
DARYAVSTIDGSADGPIINRRFPKARKTTLPEMDSSANTIQDLLTGKADFVVLDSATADSYMRANPGKIKSAFPNAPVTVFPTVMLLPPKDMPFKSMIDNTLMNIEYDGTLDAILKKYDATRLFLRNPQPVAP